MDMGQQTEFKGLPWDSPQFEPEDPGNLTPDEELAEQIATFYADPLGHVMFSYPWDTEESIQLRNQQTGEPLLPPEYQDRFDSEFGPDRWACEFLDELGEDIKDRAFDGHRAVNPIQYTTASGHGIGKSALSAWLIKFIMDTRPFAKGVVTANTSEQLKTKTWAQLGFWHGLSLTEHWFKYNTGRGAMSLVHREFPGAWRCDAQTCKEENSESFAGLHAANSTPFYLFDEASAVPDKIFEVREGGTTDGEPMTFDFGNPTRNSGRFFEQCEGRFRHRYRVRRIDSRTVAITNKDRINEWIEDYGVDSDFVKVRVLGKFPSAGSLQFMPSDLVDEAMQREVVLDRQAPLRIGVDVARYGDDETVILPRIGCDACSFPAKRFRGINTTQITGHVIEMLKEFGLLGMRCQGLFIDGTGGYGAGVIDQLNTLGYTPIEVQFGSRPVDGKQYRYKSDEMWGDMRNAMDKLMLPRINELNGVEIKAQLTQREFAYTLQGNKIHLEPKKDMKARLGGEASSPDIADALALTFAQDIGATVMPLDANVYGNQRTVEHEFDPLDPKY